MYTVANGPCSETESTCCLSCVAARFFSWLAMSSARPRRVVAGTRSFGSKWTTTSSVTSAAKASLSSSLNAAYRLLKIDSRDTNLSNLSGRRLPVVIHHSDAWRTGPSWFLLSAAAYGIGVPRDERRVVVESRCRHIVNREVGQRTRYVGKEQSVVWLATLAVTAISGPEHDRVLGARAVVPGLPKTCDHRVAFSVQADEQQSELSPLWIVMQPVPHPLTVS